MRGPASVAAIASLLLAVPIAGQGVQIQPDRDLRTFPAIRSIDLEPPLPGTEKAYRDLADSLRSRFDDRAWQGDGLRARCTLRAGLPKPDVIGLECRNNAGRYIGTLRAKNAARLRDRLAEYWYDSGATLGTALLSEYRYIHPRHPGPLALETYLDTNYPWLPDYVAELLRQDAPWRVVTSSDMASGGEADRVLGCVVHRVHVDRLFGMTTVHLTLIDSTSRVVREIAGRNFHSSFSAEEKTVRAASRDAVKKLIEARRFDEEVHKPLPSTAARPPE